MHKEFGSRQNPLLVSVRSGAKISMPGMMDTVLNLGLNDDTVRGLIDRTHNERFGWDAYRRFIQMFSNVVLGMDMEPFEEILEARKRDVHAHFDNDLAANDLKDVVRAYKEHVKQRLNKPFPEDPRKQLQMAINAVFDSWNTPRAISYRSIHNIAHDLGTAVNVQAMVFGNMGETSGTGVAFTRNPSTGKESSTENF